MKSSILYQLVVIQLLIDVLTCVQFTEKLVIDTDGGADDAASILLALSAWKHEDSVFKVIAITCVNGNTIEPNVEANVLKMLSVANVTNIPIYGGAQKPLIEKAATDYYFGNDGLGDFLFKGKITAKIDKSIFASVALTKLAKKYPNQLNVLCLGPLTNIAIATAIDPSFMSNVKKFYVMGGTVAGIGNVAPGVEFNFAADPESNVIVLNSSRDYTKQEPILLYPWETVLNSKIPKSWRINELGTIYSDIVKFLNKAESKSLKDPSDFWTSADLQMTAVMIWPHLSKKSLITNVTPVVDGAARGALLVDYGKRTQKPKNVEIVLELDAEEFKEKLFYHYS
ncbi:putative uridine nucleosidase 1 [Pseudolycoriella hygida]|uniref:Uridine nucleosidase 1 n=1 Tax=Pseudolycoriella hygida TaxID=35572 RepID=A0A9Q0MQT5_9DIPT|nr:putative uridine nucleosidase 1 [Pseudolycoriella hygida]